MNTNRRGGPGSRRRADARRWVMFSACAAVALGGLGAGDARAATLVIDILFEDDPTAGERTVEPGSRVAYAVVGEVFSDDEAGPDNDGLSGLVFDIITDLGVEQPPADEIDAAVLAALSFASSTGAIDDDDLLALGGAAFDLFNPTTGVLTGGPGVIARGELVMPDVEGTFRVTIGPEGQATVLVAQDSEDQPFLTEAATFEPGEGLTITTAIGAGDGGTTDDGSTPDGGSGTDTSSTGDGTMLISAGIVGAVTVILGALGALLLGPVGFVFGLLLGAISSLVAVAGLFFSGGG